ncbi:MAG: protein phosphatase 2C domain-containing protein [Alphaproteobacteria bacterium]|nr:protein phosphatase 2C domain-containing protein [Alphaproteobacteria bacterium]
MQLPEVAALSDVGRQRDHNEDAWAILPDIGVLAVADGMGGLEHGEIASATAISTLKAAENALRTVVSAVDNSPERGPRSQLGQAMELLSNLASQRIQQVTRGAPSGTTLVVACISGGHLLVANTGDSRAYIYRDGALRCLTDDHTVAAARLRAGLITKEEHDASPYQHMLYQALGTQGEVDPDLFDEPVAAGDIVLLCSDGLTGPVDEPQLGELLGSDPDLDRVARALIDAANTNGGPDNITVVLARVPEGVDAHRLESERRTLTESTVLQHLSDVDRRLLRHYLDRVNLTAGASVDAARGIHMVLSGALKADGDDTLLGPGSVCCADIFARGEGECALTAAEDTEALVLSSDSYEALERRRPRVAARLMRGLLQVMAGE